MSDTDFYVPAEKAHRFAACYSADPQGGMTFHAAERKGTLTLQDDPDDEFLPVAAVVHLRRRRSVLDGGRLSHLLPRAAQRRRARRRPADRAEDVAADDRPIICPADATCRRCRARCSREATYNGIGFGLGFSVTMDPAKTLIPGSAGEYAWGGAATTSFWIDPAEELIAIFMTQVMPSSAYPIRRELRTMVYAAITESNL